MQFQAQNTCFNEGKCTNNNQELSAKREHMSMAELGTQRTLGIRNNCSSMAFHFLQHKPVVLQTIPQLGCPSLYTFQPLNVLLAVKGPKQDTGVEVQPHLCPVQGDGHCSGLFLFLKPKSEACSQI